MSKQIKPRLSEKNLRSILHAIDICLSDYSGDDETTIRTTKEMLSLQNKIDQIMSFRNRKRRKK